MRGLVAVVIAATLCSARTARAQEPVVNRPPDTSRVDSLRKKPDTLSETERLLRAQAKQRVQLAPLPIPGTGPLQPAGTRVVFTRDSIDWAAALDLGELLERIPGVSLARGDWFGGPVLIDYFGRAAGSVEYVRDGVPILPIGPDSVAWDPATTTLQILDRVEVEISPSLLRVSMFTRRHDVQSPRTKIGAGQGDRGAARYFGSFEERYPGGLGVALAADYLNLNPNGGGTGGNTLATGWLQLGYVPTPHFGVQAQFITNAITRNLLLDDETDDTLSRQVKGTRNDAQLRLSWHDRADGLGRSLDLFAARTSWSSDSTPGHESVGLFGATAALRRPLWSAQLNAWHYMRWTPLDARADLGWAPDERLSASLQLVAQVHRNDRSSHWATGRIGVTLPAGFRVGASVSDGSRVDTPTIRDDTPQRFTDYQVTAGFDSPRLSLDGGYTRSDAWRPTAYPEFLAIAGYAPLPRTDWLTVHARLAPLRWFTLESRYEHPLNGALPDGVPPHHALSTATIRSRFLHNFPSGIFELKVQGVLDSWSAGVGGRDAAGLPIVLPGALFFRGLLQLKLGPFIAYYDRSNLRAVRTGYVPGYRIQELGSTYGIRWEFTN